MQEKLLAVVEPFVGEVVKVSLIERMILDTYPDTNASSICIGDSARDDCRYRDKVLQRVGSGSYRILDASERVLKQGSTNGRTSKTIDEQRAEIAALRAKVAKLEIKQETEQEIEQETV